MQLNFSVQSVKLDSNTIVADVHSEGYDAVMRYDREALNEWLANAHYHIIDINKYWLISKEVDDTTAKKDLTDYINSSHYLLSQLRDAIRLKEIEAVIYEWDEGELPSGKPFPFIKWGKDNADHLHSLITQYGDGRVETEGLKVK